jgi:hypothetical protein
MDPYPKKKNFLVEVDGTVRLRGSSSCAYGTSSPSAEATVRCDVPAARLWYGFGDYSGFKGAVTKGDDGGSGGDLLLLDSSGAGSPTLQRRPIKAFGQWKRKRKCAAPLGHLAVAGNGKVCASFG